MLAKVRAAIGGGQGGEPRAGLAQQFAGRRLHVLRANPVEGNAELHLKQGIGVTGMRHYLQGYQVTVYGLREARDKNHKTVTMERAWVSIRTGRARGFPPNSVSNVFALVIYIPDPLGRFLDDLRTELVPGCNPHAHVSVLPPRPLAVDWRVAGEQVQACAEQWTPFEIVLGRIRIFPVTNVIYLELAKAAGEMFRIHDAMNSEALAFNEPFAYHPHITLAQEIPPGEVAGINRRAEELWDGYTGPAPVPRRPHGLSCRTRWATAGSTWRSFRWVQLLA